MDDFLAPPRRVFLSHTSELACHPSEGSFVAAAQSAITRAGDAVVEMSFFPASPHPPAEACEDLVRQSDLLIVLAGFRYGSEVPRRSGRSYVELEYDVAGEAGLPRLAFLLSEESHGPVGFQNPAVVADQRFQAAGS